ncbi:USP6 N-terminal-like protein isoform X2 [Diaphorina citri]|uniref:USP6 N-terminal-like protein isoform X1 n=1 Tax=Diaphorina citri TaxID=121845 RepID=A0A1S3CTU6_DIACI|nr:USP6 N-terminal-like protein isoform X1 [Diaphorina citri]XP_026676303.1 USP6 N-terminal-like protein isoform X2 [Diaphorina citri]
MNSEELLLRAAEERHAIVERYLKGRHAGAEIHSWEEPDNDFYGNFDRFGFITDSKNEESSAQKDGLEKKDKEIELEREKKWAKMFHKWDKVPADKLKRRVYKGIPNSCRGRGWSLLLNLPDPGDGDESNPRSMDMRQRYEESTRKYEEMRDLAWKYSPDIRQIDLDVNRTYREHNMFRDRYSVKQTQLFNVLAAYSVYNLEIGYCQGMSQIAAVLLMYLSEEEAFWALSSLVSDSKYSMHGFFIPGFPKLLRYQEHHDKIMSKFLPKLKKHLDKNNVDTGIYTLKWFFQCFLDRIPFKLTLRVWDIYILEGERIMTAMAYNLLKMHQRQLAKLSMDDILHFIQVKLEKQFQYTDDATIESLQKCLEELKRNKLDYAGQPSPAELPKSPLGVFKPDAHAASFEQKIGRRSSEFSSVEKATQETVITRRDTAVALAALADRNSSIGTDASSKISFEPSLDDASSIANGGSRRSLADTSVTSTADISALSSHISAGADTHSIGTGAGSDMEVFVHSTGPSTPRATTPRSPRVSRSPDDRIRIYVPYESPSQSPKKSPKKSPPRHQNSHDSDATIMNSTNGTPNGLPVSLPNSYSTSYIPPRSPSKLYAENNHRSISNPTSIYEQYETNKITIHIVDDNLATPLGERIPNSVSSPFHMEPSPGMIHMDLK